MLSYYVSLCSEFRVVASVTISAYTRCLVRLYLQLRVGGFMSYLRHLCLLAQSSVQYIVLCFVFADGVGHVPMCGGVEPVNGVHPY